LSDGCLWSRVAAQAEPGGAWEDGAAGLLPGNIINRLERRWGCGHHGRALSVSPRGFGRIWAGRPLRACVCAATKTSRCCAAAAYHVCSATSPLSRNGAATLPGRQFLSVFWCGCWWIWPWRGRAWLWLLAEGVFLPWHHQACAVLRLPPSYTLRIVCICVCAISSGLLRSRRGEFASAHRLKRKTAVSGVAGAATP